MKQTLNALVTGASGRLGRAVCKELQARGHRVRATDAKFQPDLGVELELGDLRDELFVYRVMRGIDAVVHLGNHPNAFAGPSRQRLLAENTAMNVNVLQAAVDLGVGDVVFASSIQVMLSSIGNSPPPYDIPYLPIDGEAPPNPRSNTYALSKEFCERMLQLVCSEHAELAATSLRFPMLIGGQHLERFKRRKRASSAWLNLGEVMAFLAMPDAARLVALVLERRRPGYRQYLPAVSLDVVGASPAELIQRYYAHVELRRAASEIEALIDVSALQRDFGWAPTERLSVTIDDD